jgi:uncharacterized protein YbjT (DUF2867 family)
MIVVTTPTGKIGRQLIEALLAADEAVRVIVRDPSKLPVAMRERVEVVPGSHGDAGVVDRAFRGADAVFWLMPPDPHLISLDVYPAFTRPACNAIRTHGVRHVVSVSNLGRGTPFAARAGFATAALAKDDQIAETGVNFRALTLPSFMDNLLLQVPAIQGQGTFSGAISADRKRPTCATRDIAAAAAKLFVDRSWTGRGDVPVLGPEDLSCNDMAGILSDVLGRPIRYQQMTFDALAAQLKGRGMSDAFVNGFVEMMRAKDDGMDNAEPRTPAATTPTSLRVWCEIILKPAILALT